MDPEKAFCPNCQAEATKIGNEITCAKCDAIFVFNKKGEPKVKQIGIAERLERIEQVIDDWKKGEPVAAPVVGSDLELEADSEEPDREED